MVQALRDDVKDFCWILTFSDWAKIRKFVNFGGFQVSENAQNVHISMYLASVHVDLVSVQFTVSGHKRQCEETSLYSLNEVPSSTAFEQTTKVQCRF